MLIRRFVKHPKGALTVGLQPVRASGHDEARGRILCVWVCTYPSTAPVNVDGKLATEEIDIKPPLKFISFHQLEHSSEVIMEQAVLKKPFSAVKHTLLASLLSLSLLLFRLVSWPQR